LFPYCSVVNLAE